MSPYAFAAIGSTLIGSAAGLSAHSPIVGGSVGAGVWLLMYAILRTLGQGEWK